MKHLYILIFIVFLAPFKAISYPWTDFKDADRPSYFELDVQTSYFFNNDSAFFLGGNLEYHKSTIDIDLGYRYSFLDNQSYFRFGELLIRLPIHTKLTTSLGFRDFVWSEADRYWNHGLWQPRYLLDAFRPIQTSLPGFYIDYSNKNTQLVLYGSYFYLPDIIAFPKLKDGSMNSNNPFFSALYSSPSNSMAWDLKELKPFNIESFLQPLYAAHIRHQTQKSNLSLSYAYKPINQLQFRIQSQGINLSSQEDSQITITNLDYFTSYHHLLTAESEFYLEDSMSVFLSLLYDLPKNSEKSKETGWISDRLESQMTASALMYFKEEVKDFERVAFTLGYTKTFEGDKAEDIENVVTEELEYLFKKDLDWKHAVSFSMEYWTKRFLKNGFQFNARLNHSLDNKFYMVSLDSYANLSSVLRAYISGDIIFSSNKQYREIPLNSSIIRKYEDLSRVLFGVKYVF